MSHRRSHADGHSDGGLTHGADRRIPTPRTYCGAAKLGARLGLHWDPRCHSGHQHLVVIHSHHHFW